MAERYVHLDGNLYYDSQDRVIVKNMGNRYVFLRHDRRIKQADAPDHKRLEDRLEEHMIKVGTGMYFDKLLKQLYKKNGDKLVLYSRDRRKEATKVPAERRKIK
jgi:hypothetical protein